MTTSFDDLLAAAEHTAVKFELRDEYMTSDPAYVAWQAGEDIEKIVSGYAGWTELARTTTARGVVMRRARLVSEPVSEYVRFEHAVTPGVNLAAGEDIRWLSRMQAATAGMMQPPTDMWIVDAGTDTARALLLSFSGDGNLAGDELVTEPQLINLWAEAFARAWELAKPHQEYEVSTGPGSR